MYIDYLPFLRHLLKFQGYILHAIKKKDEHMYIFYIYPTHLT